MSIVIELTKGYMAIVDAEDADIADIKWHARVDPAGGVYAKRSLNPGNLHMHRVILERVLQRQLQRRELVDHINGNGLDNRRANLRLADSASNSMNKRVYKNSITGFKGVKVSGRKFRACIQRNKIPHYLGTFDTPEEAHAAYLEAANLLFGDFAANTPLTIRKAS